MKAYLKERLYVPISHVEANASLLDSFTYKVEAVACQRCTSKHENPDACLECPLYETREIRTYSRNKGYIGFCRGNLGKIFKEFRDLEIVDQRTDAPFKYNLKFTSQLWANQVVTTSNWWKYKYGIIESPPRSGKAQPLYSLIKVPNGWKAMGDMKIGDAVCTPDGKTASVIGVFPQGLRPTYRITFEDGRTTDCDENHLWKVLNTNYWYKTKGKVLSLKEIMNLRQKSKIQLHIPLIESCQNGNKELPLNPYLLGLLLGDGCIIRNVGFSNKDDAIIKDIKKLLLPDYVLRKTKGDNVDYTIVAKIKQPVSGKKCEYTNYYVQILVNLGLYGKYAWEKFIPEIYKEASIEQRLELLRGLMDTDGGADKANTSHLTYKVQQAGSTPYISTSSEQLALDIQYIVRSLGGLCKISAKKSFYTYKGVKKEGRIQYMCRIRYNTPEDLYKLERKRERVRRNKNVKVRCRIKDIKYVGEQQTQCIMIDHPDHLYITDNFIVTHNTIMSSFITCSLRQKTLVLTHQQDLLDQFLTTFRNHTNLKELQEQFKTDKIVGVTNCREDLADYDVCLCTYQSFITDKGKDYLEAVRNTFGLVIVDECHLSGADCFRTVVNSLNTTYRLGLSATPERKDGLECLVHDILGPVTAAGQSDEMHCKVVVMNTGVEVHPFRQWTTFIKRLSENNKRNEQICNTAKKDVDNGRYVLIVTERVKHIDALAAMLRKDGLRVATYDGRVTKFTRKGLLDDIRAGKHEVVIAMRKMIKLGIDIPLLDTYYHVIPMAYDKNYYQEMSRVRTPYPVELEHRLGKKKPTPLIRVFLDRGHGAVYACYKIVDKVHTEQEFEVQHTESLFVKEKKKGNSW